MPFKDPHPIYHVWQSMRDRCRNPNNRQFQDYGGRGISICDRWNTFANFVQDMGERPSGFSLDRIENDGNYEPSNCRWADRKTQQRNQRRAVFVYIQGKKHRVVELIDTCGKKPETIIERAERGMSYEEVIFSGTYTSSKAKRAVMHCKRGHEFNSENTSISPQGWRRCRACHNDKMRKRNAVTRSSKAA